MSRVFADMAERYDSLRPLSTGDRERLQEMLSLVHLTEDDSIVEVGAGTGRITLPLAYLTPARVVAVDSEAKMLAVGRHKDRAGRVRWEQGTAYRLPLGNDEASLVLMVMVVHHLKQRGRAFREALRVLKPEGHIFIWTFTRRHIEGFYLNQYFPSIARIDLQRFPAIEAVERELKSAGFQEIETRIRPDEGEFAVSEVVDRVRGRYISTLSLLPPLEYRLGLQQLEEMLSQDPEGMLPFRNEWALVSGKRPVQT